MSIDTSWPNYDNLPQVLESIYNKLVPYQRTIVDHTDTNPKSAIDAVGGTGKSLMALYSVFRRRPHTVLIVCNGPALYTWQKEIAKWFPEWSGDDFVTVIEGQTPAKRQKCWSKDSLFYICTYGTLRADQKTVFALRPQAVIADEYHKGGLKNRNSATTKVFKVLETIAGCIIPTSGSGIRKGPQDLWSVLNILNPKKFPSYWKFVYTYCHIEESRWGKQILGPKNTERMLEEISSNYVRVPRAISDAQKPKLLRKRIVVKPTKLQRDVYNQLAGELVAIYEKAPGDFDMIGSSTIVGAYIKMRKLLICPAQVDIPEMGNMVEAILDQITNRDDPHTVIFTPFLDAIPHFVNYFQEKLPGVKVMKLQGGDDWRVIKEVTDEFRANKKTLCIVSLQFAQSFELESAEYCHFAGFDWDQNANEQCEWRLQRMTADITKPITAYYYMHMNSVEEDVMDTLNTNTASSKLTFKSIDELKHHLGVDHG